MYEFISAHPEVEKSHITGPRWQDWVREQSLQENVDNLMPDADVVFIWRPFGIVEFGRIKDGQQKLKQLKVSAYQDNPIRNRKEAVDANLDLLFYHDLWDRQFFEPCGIRSVYNPLAIHLPLYNRWIKPQSNRTIPVLLAGNLHSSIYPLRGKFESLIRHKQIPGRLRNNLQYRYTSRAKVNQEQGRYATLLCDSQIALVSTAAPKYGPLLFRKYLEAMAAGCVVVADFPAVVPRDIRDRIVPVSTKMPDQKIASIIHTLLGDDVAREQQRLANRKVIENNYTYEHFADRWVKAVQESLEI